MLNDSSESDNGILGVIRGNPCNSSRSSDVYSNVGKWQVVALRMGIGLSCIDIIQGIRSKTSYRVQAKAVIWKSWILIVLLVIYDQEKQIVLLLDKCIPSGQAWLMILQIDELPYIELTETPLCSASLLNTCLSMVSRNFVGLVGNFCSLGLFSSFFRRLLQGAIVDISLKDGRARLLPYLDAVPPLAVSGKSYFLLAFSLLSKPNVIFLCDFGT